MFLFELLGIDAAPGRSKYHRTGKANGRPAEFKIRPRPKKNLWFDDDKLWHNDLESTRDTGFDLVSTENEEVIACDKDRKMAYGKWDKKKKRGITYNTPHPFNIVTNPNGKFSDFVGDGGGGDGGGE